MDATKLPFLRAAARSKLLLGVVHLPPLPGSPRFSGSVDAIIDAARRDAEQIVEAGFDGYVIENFGDAPFLSERVPPHVISLMTRIVLELPRKDRIVGINVLRNDALGALGVAFACGLDFVRVNVHTGAMVTDQGIIEGKAAVTLRERRALDAPVAILADVNVKHAAPLGSRYDLASASRDTAYRGLADALIVTGAETGLPASLDDVRRVREAVPDRPILVGSGATRETIRGILAAADGAIVGSSIKEAGRAGHPVDPARARELVREARP